MENFAEKLASFVAGVSTKIVAARGENVTVEVINGSRYAKVVVCRGELERSAYCFVDKTNGNVLKAASWNAPAKHARGNIFNADNGLGCCGPYSVAYLR